MLCANKHMGAGGDAENSLSRVAVYAIGGNALSNPGKTESNEEQALALAKVLSDIVDLLEIGYRVVVTHGNGPQVGDLLLLEERAMLDDDLSRFRRSQAPTIRPSSI